MLTFTIKYQLRNKCVDNNGTSFSKPVDQWDNESDRLITNKTITKPYQKFREI